MSRFLITNYPYQVSMDRFIRWENGYLRKPKKSIQEARKARRKIVRASHKHRNFPTRRSKSFINPKPKIDGLNLSRKESCPNLYDNNSFLQEIEKSNITKLPSRNAFLVKTKSMTTGRKFALLRPNSTKPRCCCSEHVLLNLNLKYYAENCKSLNLKKICGEIENFEDFTKKTEIKLKKSQSLIFLSVCDPKCSEKQHQIVEENSSCVKRVKHFICCCVQKSKSHTSLETVIKSARNLETPNQALWTN